MVELDVRLDIGSDRMQADQQVAALLKQVGILVFLGPWELKDVYVYNSESLAKGSRDAIGFQNYLFCRKLGGPRIFNGVPRGPLDLRGGPSGAMDTLISALAGIYFFGHFLCHFMNSRVKMVV